MSSCFCCDAIRPYRPQYLDHEAKFTSFMAWVHKEESNSAPVPEIKSTDLNELHPYFAVQLVRQVNFGPLESKRYFITLSTASDAFKEVTESDLIRANFQKLNAYKNFRCDAHNRFFEVNLYQRDPINKHHWRDNLARPATDIDL
ncbi:hypothetical protein NCS52_00592800 [Fusarium sp. LHS14.1]|nr:hypothetical protein NCS52_00592800 [Fusarium sp. LHS14.1]